MVASAITPAQPHALSPRDSAPPAAPARNVGELERWLSLLGGGILALALVRRSLGSVLLVCGAGTLLYRGMTGHCPLYETMAVSTTAPDVPPAGPGDTTEPDEPARIVLASS